jgi:hypothetical protein
MDIKYHDGGRGPNVATLFYHLPGNVNSGSRDRRYSKKEYAPSLGLSFGAWLAG